jgi:ZIP family zinc transporter
MGDVFFALALTLMAGLSTGLGGLLVVFFKAENKKLLSICLSFSAGVMLYVSFAEILFKGFDALALEDGLGGALGYAVATLAFFGGVGFIAVIDKLMPHEPRDDSDCGLKRTGIMSGLAIAIHNLPEGFLTFMAAMYDPALGISVAIAIALHNIPEGVAMASPIYFATGSRKKAIAFTGFSGLSEPIGGLIAWFLLRDVFADTSGLGLGIGASMAFGISFAFVGGIMVFVAMHQLLPTACKYGNYNNVIKWVFIGMGFIALSLIALRLAF